EKIGEIIAEKRKEKNMTQGQFAEKLSITHQAVSKWERGEAMPEISKLMEVAKILEISLDEILSPDITSSSLDYELNNQENNVLNEQKYLNKYDEKYYLNKENISFGDFYEIASKLSQEALLDGAKKFKREYGLYGIRNLFKFMENKTADQIALESFGINSYNDLKLIFKYLSEDVLNSIVKKIYINVGISGIVEAAPFIKQEIIEKLAFESFCISGIKVIVPIAKFISPKLLQEMAFDEVESVGTWNTIDAIIPILPSENVFNLAYKFYKDHELASFNGRWNLIGRVNTARLVAEYVKDNKYIKDCWSWCDYILPFCQQEVLEQAIIKGYEVNGIDSIKSVIKYLSSKTKKIILKENGIKNKEKTIS
ncbi:MAG: helix-turn-helix transcriptional regulator, partial [Oscillospiraceae bacterium]